MRNKLSIWVATFAAAIALSFLLSDEAMARNHIARGQVLQNPEMHQRGKGMTPYGDFCPKCNLYGAGKRSVSHKAAIEALRDYFSARGLGIGNVRGRGRFLKVDIYRNGKFVDRILFDRRTGRMRSVF